MLVLQAGVHKFDSQSSHKIAGHGGAYLQPWYWVGDHRQLLGQQINLSGDLHINERPYFKGYGGIPEDGTQLSFGLHIPTCLHTYSPSTHVYPHIQDHIPEYTHAFLKNTLLTE